MHDQSFEAKENICACKGLEQGLCQPVKTTKNEEYFIKIRMRMHRHRSCAAAFGARGVRHQWAQSERACTMKTVGASLPRDLLIWLFLRP
ncbi:MAG: hypothetical protein ACTJGN_16550, partial [Pseudomonas helleri]|uniref:hypothetical protein n=1 Tax=Pseudomonas helleri TaxID=1608996 RepID=UPI003F9D8CD0